MAFDAKAYHKEWVKNNREKMRAYKRKYDRRMRERADYTRRKWLQLNYNLTIEQYDQLLDEQEGVCAVCGGPETRVDYRTGLTKRLSVDHDHACCDSPKSCGECVRGLLCSRCNVVLGLTNDDLELLAKLAHYVGGDDV